MWDADGSEILNCEYKKTANHVYELMQEGNVKIVNLCKIYEKYMFLTLRYNVLLKLDELISFCVY